MNSSHPLARGLLLGLSVAALALVGCATRGFVRDYVETQVAPQRDINSRLQGDIADVRVRADSADAHALAAQALARNAMDEAAAARRLATKIATGELNYNVVSSHEVHFDFDESHLDGKSRRTLDDLASELEKHPRYVLEIVGHTDDVGSSRYNLRLGQERAETVRRYLNDEHRIPLSRMATISFGSGKPVSHGEGAEARALNRRAEIRLLEVQDVDLAASAATP
ncbi:MAG TPA: OmpA family protein [Candidatus Saccharimonadales bacterium]|nr:OmpA family protein [Candidatus Saccharimonadales bacterium]